MQYFSALCNCKKESFSSLYKSNICFFIDTTVVENTTFTFIKCFFSTYYYLHSCTYCKCIVYIHLCLVSVCIYIYIYSKLFEFSQTKHISITSMQIKIRASLASPIIPSSENSLWTLPFPSSSLLPWILTTYICCCLVPKSCQTLTDHGIS